MTSSSTTSQSESWLRTFYLTRAAFSIAWVALICTVAKGSPSVAGVLLVLYPAWDALANLVDAKRSGGFAANATQTFNADNAVTPDLQALFIGEADTLAPGKRTDVRSLATGHCAFFSQPAALADLIDAVAA